LDILRRIVANQHHGGVNEETVVVPGSAAAETVLPTRSATSSIAAPS
jgi:hypothetical protein